MKRLRQDPFGRPERPRNRTAISHPRSGLLFASMFAAVALLVVSRLDHPAVHAIKGTAAEALAPILEAASVPAAALMRLRRQVATYMDLFVEIDRLKLENQQLKQYVWRAQMLEAEASSYRAMLKGVQEPGIDFITARVIVDSRGVFVRSVLINAGRDQGLRNGYAVINGDGLVGRIVDSGAGVARVLLLTDLNSRIPVLVGSAGERAILHGDNGSRPALEHLQSESAIKAGDGVFTSGQDGILPKGLRIGTVTASHDALVVDTHARLDTLEYVSVLLFDGPGVDLLQSPTAGIPERKAAARGNLVRQTTVMPE